MTDTLMNDERQHRSGKGGRDVSEDGPFELSRQFRWSVLAALVATVVAGAAWRQVANQRLYENIVELMIQDRQSEAQSNLEQILSRRPDDPRAELLLVRSLRAQGQFERARLRLSVLERDGFSSDRINDERILIQARAGQMALAEQHLSRLLTSSEADTRDICESFVTGYRLNFRFDEADELLKAWEKDYPDDFRPAAHRGLMAQMAGLWGRAATQLESAITLGDWRPSTKLRLAQCYEKLNKVEEAFRHYQLCAQSDSENRECLLGMASMAEKLGQEDKAISSYQKCLKISPQSFDARLGLARIDFTRQHFDDAQHGLEQLLNEWPEDAKTLYQYAQLLSATGRTKEAEDVLQKWMAADEKVRHMEDLIVQLQRSPDDIALRAEIGVLLLKHYSREMGVQYLQSVLILASENQVAHAALADYFENMGQVDKAGFHRKRAEGR